MKMYIWKVYKNCRVEGYVKAYGEWDALRIARKKYGENIFLERDSVVSSNPSDLAGVAVVSEKR